MKTSFTDYTNFATLPLCVAVVACNNKFVTSKIIREIKKQFVPIRLIRLNSLFKKNNS